ncbi:MAG: hypothetical protein H7Y36_08180 [Armatimonadetes bacterium]|nr:hypothetical protein [Akkermansiaceae bacterium]
MVLFQFDQRRGTYTSILLFILCIAAAFWLSSIVIDTGNEGGRTAGVWILAATGVVVPLIIFFHGLSERSKGDLMRYSINEDVLELPRIGQSIDHAKQRVYFSYEHYIGSGDAFFELNLVVDGQRIKFLSSIFGNGLRPITKPLEEMGFAVNHHKIKIK